MRRRTCPHTDVRSRNRDPSPCETTATPEDLGQSHRAALRSGQGARRLGAQVGGSPAQHVAIRATVPLALAADISVVRRDRVPTAPTAQLPAPSPWGDACWRI